MEMEPQKWVPPNGQNLPKVRFTIKLYAFYSDDLI